MCGSYLEEDAHGDDGEVDWHDADEECEDLDSLNDDGSGRGLWIDDESNGNESHDYHSSSLEDSEMQHLNQLHTDFVDATATSPDTVDNAESPTDHILFDSNSNDTFDRGLQMAMDSIWGGGEG